MGARWCSSHLQLLAAGSSLEPGASCWKVGSYLPMPGGLHCSMLWFPAPVNYLSQYDPGCWCNVKPQTINLDITFFQTRIFRVKVNIVRSKGRSWSNYKKYYSQPILVWTTNPILSKIQPIEDILTDGLPRMPYCRAGCHASRHFKAVG